jgi:hypothetical protein
MRCNLESISDQRIGQTCPKRCPDFSQRQWIPAVGISLFVVVFNLFYFQGMIKEPVTTITLETFDLPPQITFLESNITNATTGGTHKLRFNWTYLPPQSEIAKRLQDLQRRCSLPVKVYAWRGKFSGMGSDLHVWSNQLWLAMLESHSLWSESILVVLLSCCANNLSWGIHLPPDSKRKKLSRSPKECRI